MYQYPTTKKGIEQEFGKMNYYGFEWGPKTLTCLKKSDVRAGDPMIKNYLLHKVGEVVFRFIYKINEETGYPDSLIDQKEVSRKIY